MNQEKLTFARSRSGNKNDGADVEQKNWHHIRQVVGDHRYGRSGELELLSKIWQQQRLLTNHFVPPQKLIIKERKGAKISKKYDRAATPYQRVLANVGPVDMTTKAELKLENRALNSSAIQRLIQTLTHELLTLTTTKQGPKTQPVTGALLNDSSTRSRRAS